MTSYENAAVPTAKPANLSGPAMFHTTKTQRDYLYFAHTLLESNYALERIVFVGGDRDKAQSVFLKPLKGCTFLPCKKHVEGAGYRPDPKCRWSEAITVYGNIVQQSRRDIQREVLGKGPYDLSPTHRHLAVTASSWSGMNRKERERHFAKLGTSITEDIGEDNDEETVTQTEVIGSFNDSDLPEFLKGS